MGSFLNHSTVRKESEWRSGKNEDCLNIARNIKIRSLEMWQGIGRSRHSLVVNLIAEKVNAKTNKLKESPSKNCDPDPSLLFLIIPGINSEPVASNFLEEQFFFSRKTNRCHKYLPFFLMLPSFPLTFLSVKEFLQKSGSEIRMWLWEQQNKLFCLSEYHWVGCNCKYCLYGFWACILSTHTEEYKSGVDSPMWNRISFLSRF